MVVEDHVGTMSGSVKVHVLLRSKDVTWASIEVGSTSGVGTMIVQYWVRGAILDHFGTD